MLHASSGCFNIRDVFDNFSQAMTVIGRLHQELDGLRGSPFLCGLQRAGELEQLPVTRLQQLRAQLQHDLSTLDKVSLI